MTSESESEPDFPSVQRPATGVPDTPPGQLEADGESAADHRLDADLRDHLGAQLRAMFQEFVTEPMPDRFQRLLEELAQKGHPADEQS